MNNKSLIILLVLAVFLVTGCKETHNKAIDIAYQLTATAPDSALSVLNGVDQKKLSKAEMARYALVYTIAQDKSGLDVDNDSLLRTAYTYYNNREEDSLYAKCEYYMGKYYMLNDSTEKALKCLFNSIRVAEDFRDNKTQVMSLLKLSVITRAYDQDKALKYTLFADSLFKKTKGISLKDRIYIILNVAECYLYDGYNISKCVKLAHEAIDYGIMIKDSDVIADAYQDLSVFYNVEGNDSTLWAGKMSFSYRAKKDVQSIYALSMAYFQADSLKQAEKTIYQIRKESFSQHGYEIYTLLKQIAEKERNYIKANEYADSSISCLEKEKIEDLKAKDQYYMIMSEREVQNAQYRAESRWKTKVNIMTISLFIIIIWFILYIFYQKKKKAKELIKNKRRLYEMEIKNKDFQINSMRSFLLKKVDIINKIKSVNSDAACKISFSDKDWEEMEAFLNSTDNEFVHRLKKNYPNLKPKDVQLLMLLRLDIPNSSLAAIYNIEEKSIRQNLFLIKKKLGLGGNDPSARKFIQGF